MNFRELSPWPPQAPDTIKAGLADPRVRAGHRLALYQRAHKICHATKAAKALKARWEEFEMDSFSKVKEAPKVV